MQAPSYQPPPIDPATLSAEQQSEADQLAALQTRTQGDSASLMAQYGILAMASNTGATSPAGPATTGGLPFGVAPGATANPAQFGRA